MYTCLVHDIAYYWPLCHYSQATTPYDHFRILKPCFSDHAVITTKDHCLDIPIIITRARGTRVKVLAPLFLFFVSRWGLRMRSPNIFSGYYNLVPRVFVPLDQRSKNERLWEHPFQACAVDAPEVQRKTIWLTRLPKRL